MVERIKLLLKERNIPISRFCEDVGIAKNAMSEWKSGRIKPGIDAVVRIADYCGVTTDYLLTGKKNNGHAVAEKFREGIEMKITAEMRNCLKQLREMFYYFMGLFEEQYRLNLEEDGVYSEKVQEAFKKVNVKWMLTAGQLVQCDEYDFSNVPSIQTLKEMLLFSYEHNAIGAENKTEIARAINDYQFLVDSQHEVSGGYILKDDFNVFADTLLAQLSAISQSTNDLEKSATKKDIETAIGIMQSAIKKFIGEAA